MQNREIPLSLLDKSTQEIEQTIDFMSETMQNFLEYYKPSSNIQELILARLAKQSFTQEQLTFAQEQLGELI